MVSKKPWDYVSQEEGSDRYWHEVASAHNTLICDNDVSTHEQTRVENCQRRMLSERAHNVGLIEDGELSLPLLLVSIQG